MHALWVILLLLAGAAHARDAGQWDEADEITAWYRSLPQPDNGMSCCGRADAWEADLGAVDEEGRMVAIITDTRPDEPRYRRHIDPGTRYVIPPHKVQTHYGNPTGHVIIFLNHADEVLCFIPQGGV